MKQLVILSGKGGTGKTSVAAAFAHLARSGPAPVPAVLADADVDAANLDLIMDPRKLETHEFFGGATAVIDQDLCQVCGNCERTCRFDAILLSETGAGYSYKVDPVACDGCAACVTQCPEKAIQMEVQLAGHWFRSESRCGPLLHAALRPGQENSGKLVTLVKQQARLLAEETGASLVIVDGPPGIGCPVISAASGADLVLLVVEPTISGIHDMLRVVELASHFHLKTMVCINKADLFPEGAYQIEGYCDYRRLEVVGKIPFDEAALQAVMRGEPVTAYRPDAPVSRAIEGVWQRVVAALEL